MKRANGVVKHSLRRWGFSIGGICIILLFNTGCNERLKRMESNQVVLEEKIDQNARQAFILSKKLEAAQSQLETKIERVQEGNQTALVEARATRYEQEKLREETREFSKKWYAGLTRVEDHQRVLQNSVDGVAGTTTVIDKGVKNLDEGQDVIRRVMASNQKDNTEAFAKLREGQYELREEAGEAFDRVLAGQGTIKTAVDNNQNATVKVGEQVAALQESENSHVQAEAEHYQLLVTNIQDVASNQSRLQRLTNSQSQRLSQQMSNFENDLKKSNEEQNTLIVNRSNQIDQDIIRTQAKQDGLSKQIEEHHKYVEGMGEQVGRIENTQVKMTDDLVQSVNSAAETVGEDQKKLQETMNNVKLTSLATQEKVQAIADTQVKVSQRHNDQHETVIQAVTGLSSAHDEIRDRVESVQTQTQKITEQAETITKQQKAIQDDIVVEGVRMNMAFVRVGETQQALQQDMKRVETGQESFYKKINDMTENKETSNAQKALNLQLSEQFNMSQDMSDQINKIQNTQSQLIRTMNQKHETWDKQNETLTNRVASLEKSLGQVDQNVTSLQTNLVSQVTELAKAMKTLQEQGSYQIAQLAEDMKAFNQTLSQIQTTQSALAKRIESVDDHQKQQGKEFLAVLEKLQKQANQVTAVPVEVEVDTDEVEVVK